MRELISLTLANHLPRLKISDKLRYIIFAGQDLKPKEDAESGIQLLLDTLGIPKMSILNQELAFKPQIMGLFYSRKRAWNFY